MSKKKVTGETKSKATKAEVTVEATAETPVATKRESIQWTPADAQGLKDIRKAAHMTQAQFADAAGIARRRYSYIEYPPFAGTTVKPSKAELEAVGKVLGQIQANTATA